MKVISLNATDARAMFPSVVGTINGATLYSGFAILDMGPKSFGVMVRGEFRACCPTKAHAKRAGEKFADEVGAEKIPGTFPALATLALRRAQRHDSHVMESHEEMRAAGIKPARRVEIEMECAAMQPLGDLASLWVNRW